tara:strand:+ start:641 stop:781 length:141 start_codon:yes stop_codon:yes gene_type:complete
VCNISPTKERKDKKEKEKEKEKLNELLLKNQLEAIYSFFTIHISNY